MTIFKDGVEDRVIFPVAVPTADMKQSASLHATLVYENSTMISVKFLISKVLAHQSGWWVARVIPL